MVYGTIAKKSVRPTKKGKYKEKVSELKRSLRRLSTQQNQMQLDVFDEYEEVIEETAETDEVLGNLLRNVIGESRTVRRRLNRAIQDNEALRKRLDKLEFLVGGDAPADENQIILNINKRIDLLEKEEIEGKVKFNRLRADTDNNSDMVNNAIARTNELEQGVAECKGQIKKLKGDAALLSDEDGSLAEELATFKKFVENVDTERERIIADLTDGMDSMIGNGLERGLSMDNGKTMSAQNMANMAKAMWQLPANCDELADKGLTANENGPYLIHPNVNVDPFLVECDFSSGQTILPVKKSRNTFPECEGSECSVIDLAYDVGALQIEALKTEMKYCNQALNFTCQSTSVSDRVIWMGFDNEWNRYYNGKGQENGCQCSMDGENTCYGEFLCNCDATDGNDDGLLENKDSLPVLSLHASDVSRNGLTVTVGDLICSGRPGWSAWSSWSLCDKSCGTGGIQIRTRICEGDQNRCPGESFQDRSCNEHVCPEWSDWSDWSRCIDRDTKQNKACGERERFRLCSEDNGCPGSAIEYDQCDCVLVLGGNGHKLNASLIDTETQTETQLNLGAKVPMPALTAHCIVNFNSRIYVIGGWNTRNSVYELRECGLIPLRLQLPRDYRVHSCAVHEDRIWVCGSRDSPYACDSYDENWSHDSEQNTIYAHSYGSMVSSPSKGLTIIGGVAPMLGRNDKVEFNVDGKWVKGPSLPNVLSSHTSHVVGEDIYVFGGLIADSGRLGQVDTVYKLGGDNNWKSIGRLNRPRSHHASVPLPNGNVFVFGDPYVSSQAELWSNSTTTSQGLSVRHGARAFPAAVYLNKPVC